MRRIPAGAGHGTRTAGDRGGSFVWRTRTGGSEQAAAYGLGLIGALVYYIQQADGFWPGVLGVLKALVWPAFAVYYLLKVVGA